MRGRNPSPPHAQLRPTSTDRKEQESRQRWGQGQQRPPLSPSLGMDGSKEPVNPLTALPKCLQSCKPTRVPGLMGGMWTWGPGRPHLNSAPFLAPTKQSTITTWRPWSPWDVDPGHRGQSGHLAREQRARPRLQARVASTSKEPRWAEGQRSAAVSPGRRWPGTRQRTGVRKSSAEATELTLILTGGVCRTTGTEVSGPELTWAGHWGPGGPGGPGGAPCLHQARTTSAASEPSLATVTEAVPIKRNLPKGSGHS